jgi:hypothetical protein
MSDQRARLFLATAGLLGVTALAGVTGCSGPATNASSGHTTGMTTRLGVVSASQLQAALLARVNGAGPATKPEAGSYASIPMIQAAQRVLSSVRVTPRQCVRATVLAAVILDTGALGSSPAAVVNFKVGTSGVSEVLAAVPNSATAAAVSKPIPAGCAQYTAMSNGRAYHFVVRQSWLKGIGLQPARVLNISTVGVKGSLWSVLYQGTGFVGTITVDGPNATEAAAGEIATQAYDYAARVLP